MFSSEKAGNAIVTFHKHLEFPDCGKMWLDGATVHALPLCGQTRVLGCKVVKSSCRAPPSTVVVAQLSQRIVAHLRFEIVPEVRESSSYHEGGRSARVSQT